MEHRTCLIWAIIVMGIAFAVECAEAQEASCGTRACVTRQVCAECHSVEKGQVRSPNAAAPSFEAIANVPGMTAIALHATLQTSHRTMPNVMLNPDELSNVVAYISEV